MASEVAGSQSAILLISGTAAMGSGVWVGLVCGAGRARMAE